MAARILGHWKCSALETLFSSGQEFQRRAIVAPALTCGLWAVVEYVTVMAAAAHAMVFGARPYQLEVTFGCE